MTKMKRNNKGHILWRYALVVGFMLLFSVMIIWNMFKLTVVQDAAWNEKAKSVIDKVTPIEPERGKLLADNGTVLAANLQFYVVRIDWFSEGISKDSLMKDLGPLCDSLAAFEPSMTALEWRKKLVEDRQKILDAAHPTEPGKQARRNHAYRLFSRMLTHREYLRVRNFPFLRRPRNQSGFYEELHVKRT